MNATVVRVIGVLGLTLAMTAHPAGAQDFLAQLTHVEGAITLHRAYVPAAALAGSWLVHGDHLRTTVGRAEITFKDGSVLHVDRDTQVVVYARERFSVIDGRVFFRTTARSATGYEAHTDIVRLRVWPRGVFGILADHKHRQVLVSVAVGEAQVESPWGGTRLASRQMAMVSGATGRPYVTPFLPGRGDSFETWSSSRGLEATLSPSSPWRPSALDTVGPVINHYRESSLDTPVWTAPQVIWQGVWVQPGLYRYGYAHGRPGVFNPYPVNHYAPQYGQPSPPPATPQATPAPPLPPPALRPPVFLDGVAVGRPSPPQP